MTCLLSSIIMALIVTSVKCNWLDSLTSITDKLRPSYLKTLRPHDYVTCAIGYCCNPTYIPGDVHGLHRKLDERLYGQHLVVNTVINALIDHWGKGTNQKALTLSFHGPPGTGKNYVAQFIRNHLYKEMKYVHQFNGRVHFPYEKEVPRYKEELTKWITSNITKCGKQLFIFDEVEKMPAGVLDAIKPFIDYNTYLDRNDYRESIFIFLSNTGAKDITERVLQLWKQGINREDLKLTHFEKLILQGAFNEVGGFHMSDNIRSNLIDHYIPFLPLEQRHVRMCVLDEFRKRNILEVNEEHIKDILTVTDWGPESHQVFSKTGCKRISQKVGLYSPSYSLGIGKSEL